MSYRHFSAKERHTLMYLLQMHLSFREIGRRLGRHHTTISREVKRNGRRVGCYWDEPAHRCAVARRSYPKHTRRRSNQRLFVYVMERLRQDWSPETIAERLKVDHPRSRQLRISPEGIYRWVYEDAFMESFFHQFKTERIKTRVLKSSDHLRSIIIEYIRYYIFDRMHISIGDLSPAEFEAQSGLNE
ncbi:MAG: helix-turn-helix domain-containing protein [Pseudomonadales bacterium]|nr:helix-turn-helix domain-containing protein [Pseudomonadales bacterium]